MGNCRDCRFWGGRFHYLGYELDTETLHGGGDCIPGPKPDWDGRKACRLMMTTSEAGDCRQSGGYGPRGPDDDATGERPIEKRSLALAYGDRGGWVITEADFGCIQFEHHDPFQARLDEHVKLMAALTPEQVSEYWATYARLRKERE